jgi:DNA-binding MarR family transcriptional regulator
MMYKLINELVLLVEEYEKSVNPQHEDVALFGQWLHERKQLGKQATLAEPDWLGKTSGRSPESVINTSLVHLYRFARLHAKAAIIDSEFATPDELIYLINLRAIGNMTKTALIRLNVHEKSAGIQIINRLIMNELVEQVQGDQDKRSKIISITEKGIQALENSMENFRKASVEVTGDIDHHDKMELIRILNKLEGYHMEHSRSLLQ